MYRLLIIEDDFRIAENIKKFIQKWGIEVKIVQDFKNILNEFQEFNPHIILLDIYLPYYDGFYWCQQIREESKVPIIFISSASDNMNIIMAINMGGDDFIVKPFDLNILNAKINALLRRTYSFQLNEQIIEFNGFILNKGNQSAEFKNQKISLTKNEYKILKVLLENKQSVVSREKLMEELWDSELFIDENTLTVNINRLRKKLNNFGLENFIKTKFGVGYIIE